MAKIGSGTPYGQAGIPITLASGGFFYPPSGQYYVQTDASSQVQWWDQSYQIWRVLVAVSQSGDFSCDGVNIRIANITGAISVASFTNGSGATNGIGQTATGVTLAVSASGANGRQATLFPIVGGNISAAPTITNAGSGMAVQPLLIVSPPPPGGITAQFTCNMTAAGGINAVTNVVAGAGYLPGVVPTITVVPQLSGYAGSIPPPPATQAVFGSSTGTNYNWPSWQINNIGTFNVLPVLTLAAPTLSGQLTGVGLLDPGALYTGTPTVVVTGAGAATVTLNAVTSATNSITYIQPITF
jgi:hypothetical protein